MGLPLCFDKTIHILMSKCKGKHRGLDLMPVSAAGGRRFVRITIDPIAHACSGPHSSGTSCFTPSKWRASSVS
jgi:hypothetical protein